MKSLTKRQLAIGSALAAVIVISAIIIPGKEIRDYSYDPAFNAYISAFTSQEISRQSPIIVRLTSDGVPASQVGVNVKDIPFTFDPEIKGTAVWTDSRTVEFHPEKPLPSDQYYKASFALATYVPELPENLESFNFQFATMKQTFEVIVDGTESIDDKSLAWQIVNGSFNTADFEYGELVEKCLTATQKGEDLKVKWIHSEDGRTHSYKVDSVKRTADPSEVVLNWNGGELGLSVSGDKKVLIPAQGEFYALSAHSYNDPEQYVEIKFSDPLKAGQDLRGLIHIGEFPLRYVIDGSTVKIYPTTRIAGTHTLNVETGVKNVLGHKLQKANNWEIAFEALKPSVRLWGNGNILPRSGVLPFVFEAVSLKSVKVKVTRIYENNVLQFLQVNDLDGNRELYRVGKEVAEKTLSLEGNKNIDLHQWNRHVIDLTELVNAEPGAIYRVSIDFGKENSIYECEGQASGGNARNNNQDEDEEDSDEEGEEESSNWDYYEDDYQDYWSNRDNPCHEAYYTYNSHEAGRNILASDIGIIAKGGTEGSLLFVVTDLKTTNPIPNVALEVYDFQRQLLKRLTTDGNGMATITLTDKPFALIAKLGNQRGYLKLDDGYSLSLSKFEVGGESYTQGVKGFIYGERGVWRPGDSLYLSFMLEDAHKTLPADHPVTFSLFNPQGQEIKKIIKKEHTHGVYTFITSTSPNAATGNYRADVKVGGATFSKTLKIETVMPNRLKINLKFAKEYLSEADSGKNETEISSLWLHGAIARNLNTRVSASLSSKPTKFAKFSTYTFDDPVRRFSSEEQEVFEGTLDEEGKVKFDLDLNTEAEAPGMLQANFVTKVFEPGGNFSVDYFSMPYYPYERFVGVQLPKGDKARNMLLTDKDHPIDIVMVDAQGNLKGTDSVEVALYKLSWEWWWDQSYENVSSYNGKFYTDELKKEKILVRNGIGKWSINVKYPQWGRYMVRVTDSKGHATGKIVYIDWPGWAGRPQKDNPGGASMLSFTADKEKYTVGEKVTLSIPMGKEGRALVSIESGSKVIKAEWLLGKEGSMNTFTFETTAEMAPNIYANVTLLQPHAQTANDLPMRLYGVVPIEVYDPKTKIQPVITTAQTFRPEERATIKVSEAEGREMVYTVAVVDEGLLDLTRFKTPDPWNSFYAKEALDVKTWDLFDQVIGAYTGDLSRLLSVGGDDGSAAKGGAKVNRFRPVVKYMGPFILKPGQTATHSFMMPNYVGSVKTMVVARWEGAYGNAEKQTPVRKPVMVLGTLPRVVGPGEEIQLPVTVFAMEKFVKNVSVKIETNDFLTINGGTTRSLVFNNVGDQVVTFSGKVKDKAGKATVKITAVSGNETSVYHVDVEVRLPNPPVTQTERGEISAGQTWNKKFNYPGIAGTNKGSLEVSTTPPLNLGKRLQYLIQYPHGCIEQTTSSVFAQVYLPSLMDLPESRKKEIDRNITGGINRIAGNFQTPSGGLSYWPGEGTPSEWGTNYAGAFILEAKKRGYRVPGDFLSKWISFQTSRARTWNESNSDDVHPHGHESARLMQADRLYLLALAGAPEMGAMNRLRESADLDVVSKWRLAAAYKLAGQGEIANQLSKGLSTLVPKYKELSYSYGSDFRDQAIILECMSVMGLRDRGTELSKSISDRLCSGEWYSTQETGYSLVAMAKFYGASGSGTGNLSFSYRIGTGAWVNVSSTKSFSVIELVPGNLTSGSVEVKNTGSMKLFSRLTTEGIPLEGTEQAFSSDLALDISFETIGGDKLDPTSIEQGTDFVVEVTVKNSGSRRGLEEMALSMIFPSGWEIHNARMAGGSTSSLAEYQDIRDDRVYTYFDLTQKSGWHTKDIDSKTFRFTVNASYLGKFYLPMWKCVAMYDESIGAGTSGMWVNVVPSAN